MKTIEISTEFKDMVDITPYVQEYVNKCNVTDGICLVYVPHSTAAITTFSQHDVRGFDDLRDEINRLIPTKVDFHHQYDTPSDAAGHVKSSLIGVSACFPIHEKELIIGSSQHIYFLEFDGPRNRRFYIKIV